MRISIDVLGISPTARLGDMVIITEKKPSPSACCPVPSGSVQNSVVINSLQCSGRRNSCPSVMFNTPPPQLIQYCASPSSSPSEPVVDPPIPNYGGQRRRKPLSPIPPHRTSHVRSDIYVLALLALLLEAPNTLLEARLCFSSRRVTHIQNQLMTSTKAKAKKTLFLSPSPPQVLAA